MSDEKKPVAAWIAEVEQAAKHAADAVPDYMRKPSSHACEGSTRIHFKEPSWPA